MALVCDIKSDNPQPQQQEIPKEDMAAIANEDLEDGEIEDDDEEALEVPAPDPVVTPEAPPPQAVTPPAKFGPTDNKFPHNNRNTRFDRGERHNRYEERKRGSHLTEAEKSVMHLHKIERLERMEREKRERYKREQAAAVDDFASNIEKAIASVLKKEKKGSDDEKEEEEKRGKKRKKKDKEKKKAKQRRIGSPKADDYDETELMNIRGGSPDDLRMPKDQTGSPSPHSDYDSYDSSTSSDRSREDRKDKKKDHNKKSSRPKNRDRVRGDRKFRDRSREQKTEQFKDGQGLCLFYLQGKCNKGNDCPYSHEVPHPMKLELCKFYLMECCAKGDKCLYMHSEFPCKFYHTGLPCYAGDTCKFAHGKPLEDGLKQILFKHIETAPKEILGDFPRLSRDGALTMINQAQKALETKYGIDKGDSANSDAMIDKSLIPSLFELNIPVPAELMQNDTKSKDKADKPTARERNRPSRWQDAEPADGLQDQQKQPSTQLMFGIKGFYSERGDQDMRVNSNGDIDMRTLPPSLNPMIQTVPQLGPETSPKVDMDYQFKQDIDIRSRPQDIDIRQLPLDSSLDIGKDIDIRKIPQFDMQMKHASSTDNDDNDNNDNAVDEPNLEIVMEDDNIDQKTDREIESKSDNSESRLTSELPATLPKKQRELFLRIQAQQKENVPENQKETSDDDRNNIDWYSDDDDDCRLTIKDDIEETKPKADECFEMEPLHPPQIPAIKPVEVIEKLGDLSKIDISAEVTKLLSSISQSGALKEAKPVLKDPRTAAQQPAEAPKQSPVLSDPRRARLSSTESKKPEKLSIYEQGSISIENAAKDVDLRNMERDLDMRPMYGDTDLRPTPGGRPDIDLRQLGLPFKAIQNYTPASEIDASINSHAPIAWHVHLVDIPRPDYTGLKLSAHEAQNTGDPRLRKIFRLSTEEKDSPASPKESPKAVTTGIRADPRRRKMEEKATDSPQMSYSQQLNMLQSSAFYQSLTSNQKVLLNQELASKSDHSGSNDPTLNGILSSLGLIPGHSTIVPNATANTSALSILASVNNMNPMMGQTSGMMVPNTGMMGPNQNVPFTQPVNPNILSQNPNIVNQMAQSIVQPGLLGAAPGVPNLPPDFQLNFDPRQGGLLGNAPPFNNYNDNSNFNYNEEYYDEGNNFDPPPSGGRGGGRGRGGFRDRQPPRRGRNFNNRSGGRSFRNRNRTNRSRTPP